MKTTRTNNSTLFPEQLTSSPISLGLSFALLCASSASATQWPKLSAPPPLPEVIRLELGTIGVASPDRSAKFGFDKGKGQIESASEEAGNAAVGTPRANGEALLDPLTFVLSPLNAVIGAAGARSRKLPADSLREEEMNLTSAMAQMAEQTKFRELFLRTAREQTRRRLVSLPSAEGALNQPVDYRPSAERVDTVLEIALQELYLERTGRTDESFVVRIKTRARLVRADDGAVLYDQPFDYRSGSGLFFDYTLNKGKAFRAVTDTGYNKLAERMVEQLFAATTDGPMVVGTHPAVHKKSNVRRPNSELGSTRGRSPQRDSTALQFASRPVANLGSVGIYSTSSIPEVTVRRPLTKDQAVAEAISDTEYAVGDLTGSANGIDQLFGFAVALPMSLGGQIIGTFRGLSEKKFTACDVALTAEVRREKTHENVGWQLAQQLSERSAMPVALLEKPFPFGREGETVAVRWVSHGKRAESPRVETVAARAKGGRIDTVLEIHVLTAALKDGGGINSRLSLWVDARATLLRAGDGQEIYSCPVQYRSKARKFTDWAAKDAQLFRDELARCHRQTSQAVVDQLVSRRLIGPANTPNSILANN